MKELCPVCNTEYSQNVTKCEVCGFADEFGINRKWPIAEDAIRLELENTEIYNNRGITYRKKAYVFIAVVNLAAFSPKNANPAVSRIHKDMNI
jgi:hypothetical protein